MPKKNNIAKENRGENWTAYPGVSKCKTGFTGRFQNGFKANGKPWIITASDPSSAKRCYEKLEEKKKMVAGTNLTTIKTKNFAEYLDEWYRIYREPYLRPKSKSATTCNINIIKKYFQIQSIASITTNDCQLMFNETNKDYSLSVNKKLYGIMNRVFKWAVELGHITKNPLDSVTFTKPNKKINKNVKEIQALDLDDIRKIEAQAISTWSNGKPKYQMGFGIVLLFQTALRASEAMGLKWKDVDLQNKEIHVRQQLLRVEDEENGGFMWLETPELKNDRSGRTVHLNPKAIECLQKLNEQYHYQPEEYVFITANRKPFGVKNLRRSFNMMQVKAQTKLQNSGLHVIRHSAITKMFFLGMDVKTIASLAGHSPEVTMKTYTHAIQQLRERSFELMDKM